MTIIFDLTTKDGLEKVIAEGGVPLVQYECRDGVLDWDFWVSVWGDEPLVSEPEPGPVQEGGPSWVAHLDLANGMVGGETEEQERKEGIETAKGEGKAG